jgi:hypothetical protein
LGFRISGKGYFLSLRTGAPSGGRLPYGNGSWGEIIWASLQAALCVCFGGT